MLALHGRRAMKVRKMNNRIKKSKLLSSILRHNPGKAGLTLGEGGWVDISDLLDGLQKMKRPMSREALEKIVIENDKKRFSISSDGRRIRAAQGHSVKVDLGLEEKTPPAVLYHGTAKHALRTIEDEGLKPMKRAHVHLSIDRKTAIKVGLRHGRPVILEIDAARLHQQGQKFYQADNGVWLTGAITPDGFEVKFIN